MNIPVSVLIFERNAGHDLRQTVYRVLLAMEKLKFSKSEIVIVSDGSSTKSEFTESVVGVNIKTLHLEKSIGIAGAIHAGLAMCENQYVLPTPGHDMYTEEAFVNVLELTGYGDVILGCRSNISKERPIIKRIASRTLRDLYRHFFYHYIGDVHGLILYKKCDLFKYVPPEAGHGNAIIALTKIIVNGGKLIQTIAPINTGHRTRQSAHILDSIPSPKAVLKVLKSLLLAHRFYKNND